MQPKQWIPLESNPQILTNFAHALGLSPLLAFSDVWSTDLLDMVPAPQYAVMLLYPLTTKILDASAALAPPRVPPTKTQPYFCKQTIGNACGTIALLHAALNADLGVAPLRPDSFLHTFLHKTVALTPRQRADALHDDATLDAVHHRFAQEGQTSAPDPSQKVELHFICFVQHEGVLYELDGRKEAPVAHAVSSPHSVLRDACDVIRNRFMALDPDEQRFTILALTHAQQ